MQPPVKIRMAVEADAAALQLYAERLFAERLPVIFRRGAPTVEDERLFLRGRLEVDRSVVLLAETAHRIVGLLDFAGHKNIEESHAGAFGMSVDREYRGRGIGTKLLLSLFEWASSHSITRIELQAFSNNPRAISLYEQLGFQHEGCRRGAIVVDCEQIDMILMAKKIVA